MNSRAKGVRFERDVANLLEQVGDVRGLESGGDHFCVTREGRVWHVEAKNHKRLAIPSWLRQQAADAPAGALRILVFKIPRFGVFVVEPFGQWLERERERP